MLNEYKDEINKQVNEAIKEIEKGYKYCPQCKEYYKEKAWEEEEKQEEECWKRPAAHMNWVSPGRQTGAEKRGELGGREKNGAKSRFLIKAQMFNRKLCL